MSDRTGTPTYRADVVGSLLRPVEVKQAMQDAAAGRIDHDALTRVQNRAILDAIALQEACGLDVVTDGEFRRVLFLDPLVAVLDGLGEAPTPAVVFRNATGTSPAPGAASKVVTGKIGLRASLLQPEARFLLAHAHRPVKVTLPALAQAGNLWRPGLSEGAYPTRAEFLTDLLEVMRGEIAALVALGVRYIQLDGPSYTRACSAEGQAQMRALGIEPQTWLDEMIAFENRLISGFTGVTFGLHLCRGNYRSMWIGEGGYDAIAERLFNDTQVDRLLLEYDTPRAGTFAPLRFVPKGKIAVLGLISTKEADVETRDEVLRRIIEEAAKYLSLEQLALSPQCGFASGIEGNLLDETAQRQKLELVANVAREVWTSR